MNLLIICTFTTGDGLLLMRSQFRHYSAEDMLLLFQEVLEKIDEKHPQKAFTFFGDNIQIHKEAIKLFRLEKYKRHTYIPLPRYSPFLNASEFLWAEIKQNVIGQQYKTLGSLLAKVQEVTQKIPSAHFINYHRCVTEMLYKSLKREEIHGWKIDLHKNKATTTISNSNNSQQQWDIKHRAIFATEQEMLKKTMKGTVPDSKLRSNKALMIKNGREIQLYHK